MTLGSFISQWVNDNPGKAVGGILGFVLGMLLLTIGIVKTLVIILLVATGFLAGKLIDDRGTLPGPLGSMMKKKGKKADEDEDLY